VKRVVPYGPSSTLAVALPLLESATSAVPKRSLAR